MIWELLAEGVLVHDTEGLIQAFEYGWCDPSVIQSFQLSSKIEFVLRYSCVTRDIRFKEEPASNVDSAYDLRSPVEVETWRILSSRQGTTRDALCGE